MYAQGQILDLSTNPPRLVPTVKLIIYYQFNYDKILFVPHHQNGRRASDQEYVYILTNKYLYRTTNAVEISQ